MGIRVEVIELGLVDELRIFRNPVVVGGGAPFLPPVTEDVPLDLIETACSPDPPSACLGEGRGWC